MNHEIDKLDSILFDAANSFLERPIDKDFRKYVLIEIDKRVHLRKIVVSLCAVFGALLSAMSLAEVGSIIDIANISMAELSIGNFVSIPVVFLLIGAITFCAQSVLNEH